MSQPSVRAVIYLRESVEDADGIDRHRDECLRIAAEKGWAIQREYVDDGIGASDLRKNRPAYNAMIEDYEAGRLDAILCWDLDRLTRLPRQLEDWIDRAEHRGLKLVTANGEADLTTDAGRMFARVKAAISRGEIERKSARRKLANQQRAKRGVPPKGVRPTGYTLSGEIVAEEAELIRQMFSRFDQGDSLKGIAAWLTKNGTPTRSGSQRWNPSTVSSILRNPRYKGINRYRTRVHGAWVVTDYPAAWDAIVDEALFDRVNERLRDPRRITNRVGTDRRHLGSGVYVCGICGRDVKSSGKRYECRDGHVLKMRDSIDRVVIETTRAVLARPDLADLLQRPDDEAAADLTQQIQAAQARLQRTEQDYDADLIDGRRYKEKRDKINAELKSLRAARSQVAGHGIAGLADSPDPVVAFDAAPLGIRQTVVETLMEVRLLPGQQGRKFRPELDLKITPKIAAPA